MPRRTNSTTDCDDWQSQMPVCVCVVCCQHYGDDVCWGHRIWTRWTTPTIAGDDQELVVVGQLVDGNVRQGRDYLGLGRQVGALFELEIANGARQGEVAVDAAKVDEATGRLDAGLFAWVELAVVGGFGL